MVARIRDRRKLLVEDRTCSRCGLTYTPMHRGRGGSKYCIDCRPLVQYDNILAYQRKKREMLGGHVQSGA